MQSLRSLFYMSTHRVLLAKFHVELEHAKLIRRIRRTKDEGADMANIAVLAGDGEGEICGLLDFSNLASDARDGAGGVDGGWHSGVEDAVWEQWVLMLLSRGVSMVSVHRRSTEAAV